MVDRFEDHLVKELEKYKGISFTPILMMNFPSLKLGQVIGLFLNMSRNIEYLSEMEFKLLGRIGHKKQ